MDATKIQMGLTTWKNAPQGRVLKTDIGVAKNYLSQAHIEELNRIVSAYLELAENRAKRGILMKMTDWIGFQGTSIRERLPQNLEKRGFHRQAVVLVCK